ncbi:MAG: putative membrane protein [Candidatus Methanohalarchaeum thermophilum]|uniref:Membrane protein n=1 Tax=Methanohalarchaeum thermophilum TaxID=1903181 RepID=A0A1Q6DXF2_METT1|nr:MAG: putative membrane protein [Candidatus Methanohalarchaeum thermophilum]
MEFNNKRLKITTLTGALLGIFCIIGVGLRLGFKGNEWYLFGMWYNRVVMGITIGFAENWKIIPGKENQTKNAIIRGLILGTIITSAILFSTNFKDIPSWGAGLAYGIIIDLIATKKT